MRIAMQTKSTIILVGIKYALNLVPFLMWVIYIYMYIIILTIIECLKSDYKAHSVPGSVYLMDGYNYTYPNCTMPWKQSMLGKHLGDTSSNDEDEVLTCDDTLANTLMYLDYDYLKIAARGDNPNCLGKYIHGIIVSE